ncbi:MAG: hypothetical protein ABSF77_03080 [Spirochaetia bacterium]|jgi:hypothetical protein
MKKLSVIIVMLLAVEWGAFAQQIVSPSLLWGGVDFGWNSISVGGGANLETGFLAMKNLYIDLEIGFYWTNYTNLFFGAGVIYYPLGNGFLAGLNLLTGDVQTSGVDDWCFGSSGAIGYDFGWIVLGIKINIYFTNTVQAIFGLFVDFSRKGSTVPAEKVM